MSLSVENLDLFTDAVGRALVVEGMVRLAPADLNRLLNRARAAGRAEESPDHLRILAAIVHAAGGKVTVYPRHLQRPQRLVQLMLPRDKALEFTVEAI